MSFEVQEIPAGHPRGWTVLVDGNETSVKKIELVHSKIGSFTYGLRPEGYDGPSVRLLGGGGSVTLPYARSPEGHLLVGLLLENRPNLGGPTLCAMGGFKDPNETHEQAQRREAGEESGLDTARAMPLEGLPTVADRLFWVADASKDEGVHAYGLEIPFGWLQSDGENYRIAHATTTVGPKKAENLRFYHWKTAVQRTPCSYARSAIAQLLAMLL